MYEKHVFFSSFARKLCQYLLGRYFFSECTPYNNIIKVFFSLPHSGCLLAGSPLVFPRAVGVPALLPIPSPALYYQRALHHKPGHLQQNHSSPWLCCPAHGRQVAEGLPLGRRGWAVWRPHPFPSRKSQWPWWRTWCWGRERRAHAAGKRSGGPYNSGGRIWHTGPPCKARIPCVAAFSSWKEKGQKKFRQSEYKNQKCFSLIWCVFF